MCEASNASSLYCFEPPTYTHNNVKVSNELRDQSNPRKLAKHTNYHARETHNQADPAS
jgi:hypothetical protein